MESIVRLASLTISNIKNVRNGQIIMPILTASTFLTGMPKCWVCMDKMVQGRRQLLMHYIICTEL